MSPIVRIVGTYHAGLELGLIAGIAHLVGGLMLSPDLDLVSRPFNRWGLLRFIWVPYQHFIPHHRHWLSHGVLVGSALRLLYLAAWLSPILLAFPVEQIRVDSVTLARAIAISEAPIFLYLVSEVGSVIGTSQRFFSDRGDANGGSPYSPLGILRQATIASGTRSTRIAYSRLRVDSPCLPSTITSINFS